MIGIYKIENLINHKKYIGKTIDINKRFGDHKRLAFYKSSPSYEYPLYKAFRKYGLENFNFSIVEECDEKILDEKEKYWIKIYKSYGKEGYNQTPGGDGSPKINHEEAIDMYNNGYSIEEISDYFNASERTVIKILHSYNLAYLSQDEKNKLQNPKSVRQYNLKGEFIREFYSAGDAARSLRNLEYKKANCGPILKACHNYCTAYGFLWIFSNENINIKEIINQIKEKESSRIENVSKAILKRCSMPVNQYDLNGKYIRSYDSASEARRSVNNQHISDVCNGKWLTAAKYYWRYISEEFPKGKDLNIDKIKEWRNKTKGGEG